MPVNVVVDIGAGMYKTFERKLNSNNNLIIIAFEPHPELYQKLINAKEKYDETIKERLLIYNCAISDKKTKHKDNFYILNDPVASSLSRLNGNGAAKWKYPFGRKRFAISKIIKVDVLSLKQFFKTQTSLKIKRATIDLLNVNMQGDCLKILNGIDTNLYNKIKRIIIKCIDTPFELYNNQPDIVDIIDKLRIHNFTLLRGAEYSRGQEQILEFINTRFRPSQADLNPLFRITEIGEFIIHF